MEQKRSKRLKTALAGRYGKQEGLFQLPEAETSVRLPDSSAEAPLLRRAMEAHSGETYALRGLLEEGLGQTQTQEPASAGRFLLDSEGVIKETNQAGADLLGTAKTHLKRRSLISFVTRKSREAFISHLKRVVERGRRGESELEMKRTDGTLFSAHVQSSPLIEDGRVTDVYSVMFDVSRQRSTEEGFRESEERYRIVVENSSDGMAIFSADQIFLEVNPRCLQIFGYANKEELVGSSIANIVHPDDRERLLEMAGRQRGEHTPVHGEFKGLRKDGSALYVEASVVGTVYKKEAASLAFLRDITERRYAEEERRRLSLLVEHAVEMILVVDNAGIVQYANLAFLKGSGKNSGDLTGRHVIDCATGEDDKGFYEALWARLQKRKRWTGRMTLKLKDGGFREFDVNLSPMRNAAGDVFNQAVTCRDITAEAILEQQLRQAHKMEAIGTLAGGIAHDFNNILAAIIGNAELALDDVPVGSSVHHNLEQIFKASQRARDLVKQILTFSRRENQEAVLVAAGPLITETMKLLRSSIPATIQIHHRVEPGRNTIMVDAARLQQILMNLCANAAHAMREKGGILEVTLREYQTGPEPIASLPDLKPGPYLMIEVSDTGHGMSEAVMERIFDPFFTTKRPGEGTGMGLAVVHGIVKSLNGAIAVSSQPEKGSTFTVWLPMVVSETEGTVREETSPLPGGKEHILMVDDERSIVEMNSTILERLGYEVTALTSSTQALELFTSNPQAFDLVITDQTMPELTGADLARRIRALRKEIPVILMTGFSETIDGERARRMGIRRMLMKPVVKNELAEAIREVMKDREPKTS